MDWQDHNDGIRLMTVKRAAEWLSCSQANLYTLIEAGELAVVQVGARKGYRIDMRDLEAFVAQRKVRFEVRTSKLLSSRVSVKHLKL